MQASSASGGNPEQEPRTGRALERLFDELGRSLDDASQAVRAHVRDIALASTSEPAPLQTEPLRRARRQLERALAVMDRVGLQSSARVLRATKVLLERLEQEPARCKDDVAIKLEHVSMALVDYLGRTLKESSASSKASLGEQQVHRADLWPFEWRWVDIVLPVQQQPLVYDRQVQTRIDECLLKLIKSGDMAAANVLYGISLGFVAAQNGLQPRLFWQICAAFFESVSLGLCPVDADGKHALSGILRQYRTLAGGGVNVSERLLRELLFVLAQLDPSRLASAPVLLAIRQAYGLTAVQSMDGERHDFAHFDPAHQETGSVKAEAQGEEQVKVIGSLRIDISVFNTYLNETDEWSRCLFVELSEWALELHRTLAPSTLAWTHSLAESSASVGLRDLAGLAEALERALRHVQGRAPALAQHVKVFLDAADDIRRLLHQFAAGFLKQPEPRLIQALSEILKFEFPPDAAVIRP
jgi:hypothetical protein